MPNTIFVQKKRSTRCRECGRAEFGGWSVGGESTKMTRWLRPILGTCALFLLVYVILNQSTDFVTVLPRFSRLNTLDAALDPDLSVENGTTDEVLLFDHPQAVLDKLVNVARAECHDALAEKRTDIRLSGQNVTYSQTFTAHNSPDDLKVHLVFHSHIDPGWLKTFYEYYQSKVQYIFENFVNFLTRHPKARFIWSEMSYLELWYRKASSEMRQKLLTLLQNGQLELCGGAWVMTDEATPYFGATIDNIIEGQRFILDELNSTATSSWSVDPFGHGAATPYLLSLTGIENLVVGRLDKHVKENLVQHGSLLFKWAQPWNTGTETESLPLISSLPKTYYTTADACGPDGHICCQFDYGNTRSMCSSRAQITNATVKEYAEMLTKQYRQLQPYYRNRNLLIAIGDDFFFSHPADFTENYRNYALLIEHINSNPQYKMKVQFSTVGEYFKAVRRDTKSFPVLRGDFMPYTEDKNGGFPWWTGFYVHRPYFKRLERVVQGKLHRVDILRTLLGITGRQDDLQVNRRNLALAQHHDAITGTSKPHVMADFTKRLISAGNVFRQLEADVWGGLEFVDFVDGQTVLEFNEEKQSHRLTVFNPRTASTPQRVSLLVNRPNILVSISNGTRVDAQVFPYMELAKWTPNPKLYELVFYIRIPSLGTRRIFLHLANSSESATTTKNSSLPENENFGEREEALEGIVVDCGDFTLRFDDHGLLKSLKRDDSDEAEIKVRMTYGYYFDHGGAYVFAPSSPQKAATIKPDSAAPLVVVGPQTVRVYSKLQFTDPIKHELFQFMEIPRQQSSKSVEIRVELISSPAALDAMTFVMNLETSIDNDDSLFTDVNGLYLTKREMNAAINHAGNFYPSATSALIEDHAERLTVLFGQPTGATTSRSGHLEFFIDRNVRNSDGKGLDFGDSATNETTHLHYRIIVEKRDVAHAHKTIYLSMHSHESLQELLHPSSIHETRNAKILQGVLWPCDVQLVNIRHLTKPPGTVLLILRRVEFDCTVMDEPCVNSDAKLLFTTLRHLFPDKRMHFTSLTGSRDDGAIQDENALNERLKPFQIVTIKYE